MSTSADLSGPGSQKVWVNVYGVSQDKENNRTRYYGEIRYYGNGYGSWTNSSLSWSLSGGGLSKSGSFTIPYEDRYDTYRTLWSGYWYRSHNSDGELGGFTLTASINGSVHSSIGSGSVSEAQAAPSRIPKVPDKPGTPTVDQITSDSARISWNAPDSNGKAIQEYRVRYAIGQNPVNSSIGKTVDVSASSTSVVLTGLEPASDYRVRVCAYNGATWDSGAAAGCSDYSNTRQFDTLAGLYVSTGSEWVAQPVKVSDGSSWDNAAIQYSDGDSWEDPQ